MQLKYAILTCLMIPALAGCDRNEEPGGSPVPDQVTAYISASIGASVRTGLDGVGDGTSGSEQPIGWKDGDQFALWGIDDETGAVFREKIFQLKQYNEVFSSAVFAGDVEPMPEGSYNYYAVYPAYENITHILEYTLPAVQSGEYDPSLDAMWATTTGGSITASTDADGLAPISLSFRHLFHLMRIEIPEGRNFFDRPIKKLEIIFPQEVVGHFSFYVRDPEGLDPSTVWKWTDESNKVTVTFPDEALFDASVGDQKRYAWVFIKPGQLKGNISFRAYDADGLPSQRILAPVDKQMQAQHITPVRLSVPTELPPVTFRITCPDTEAYPNFLGEPVTALHVEEWPAGIEALGGNRDVAVVDGVAEMKFIFREEVINTELPGAEMKVTFESEHAYLNATPCTLRIPEELNYEQNKADGHTPYTINHAVPYLFYEDFAGAGGDEYNYAKQTDMSNCATANTLDGVNLPGWTGARWQTQAGTSLSATAYISTTVVHSAGRLDSPALPLKITHDISVAYDFGGNVSDNRGTNTCAFGLSTATGPINGGYSNTATYPERRIEEFAIGSGGSFTSLPNPKSITISDAPIGARLSWCCNKTRGGFMGDFAYIYIDNIKVSVGGEVKHADLDYRSYFPLQ